MGSSLNPGNQPRSPKALPTTMSRFDAAAATSVINAIRAHLAEFGIVPPVGRKGVKALLTVVVQKDRFELMYIWQIVWRPIFSTVMWARLCC